MKSIKNTLVLGLSSGLLCCFNSVCVGSIKIDHFSKDRSGGDTPWKLRASKNAGRNVSKTKNPMKRLFGSSTQLIPNRHGHSLRRVNSSQQTSVLSIGSRQNNNIFTGNYQNENNNRLRNFEPISPRGEHITQNGAGGHFTNLGQVIFTALLEQIISNFSGSGNDFSLIQNQSSESENSFEGNNLQTIDGSSPLAIANDNNIKSNGDPSVTTPEGERIEKKNNSKGELNEGESLPSNHDEISGNENNEQDNNQLLEEADKAANNSQEEEQTEEKNNFQGELNEEQNLPPNHDENSEDKDNEQDNNQLLEEADKAANNSQEEEQTEEKNNLQGELNEEQNLPPNHDENSGSENNLNEPDNNQPLDEEDSNNSQRGEAVEEQANNNTKGKEDEPNEQNEAQNDNKELSPDRKIEQGLSDYLKGIKVDDDEEIFFEMLFCLEDKTRWGNFCEVLESLGFPLTNDKRINRTKFNSQKEIIKGRIGKFYSSVKFSAPLKQKVVDILKKFSDSIKGKENKEVRNVDLNEDGLCIQESGISVIKREVFEALEVFALLAEIDEQKYSLPKSMNDIKNLNLKDFVNKIVEALPNDANKAKQSL